MNHPQAWPRLLTVSAEDAEVPGGVGSAVMTPRSQMKAWEVKADTDAPTTWCRLLTPLAKLAVPPGSVPRSVIVPRCQRYARASEPEGSFCAQPAASPSSLMLRDHPGPPLIA